MPHAFVKYTPAVEQADPDFDKNLQTVITATKKYIENSVKSEAASFITGPNLRVDGGSVASV